MRVAVGFRAAVVLAACGLLAVACSSAPPAAAPTTAVASSSAAPSPAPSAAPTPTPIPTPLPSTSKAAPSTAALPSATPKPPAFDPLTGGKAKAGPVLAVKIDNTSAGLPQYGVSQADVVYIEQVEGGLTRMIAVFHSVLPAEVGPVRSVRSTDPELLSQYGSPGLIFSGGADAPLAALHASTVVDGSTADIYRRSDAMPPPYNLHADLTKAAKQLAGVSDPKPIGFTFAAKDPRVAKGTPATTVDVVMQSGETVFKYSDGRYRVVKYGQPYSDAAGTPVFADNVLVQNVTDEPDGTVDSIGSPSYISHTVGKGTFSLIRDGRSIGGNWSRASAADPTKFLDATGQPVPFKPGKTWVLLAPQTSQTTVG